MNLFSLYLTVQFLLYVALFLAAAICVDPNSKRWTLARRPGISDGVVWSVYGLFACCLMNWSIYSSAKGLGGNHPGWSTPLFVLGELLVFGLGFLVAMFRNTRIWSIGIIALVLGIALVTIIQFAL